MAVCGALVLLGIAAIVAWGGRDVVGAPDDDDADAGPAVVARRYLRSVVIALLSGATSGLLIVGAGGRLAMRLLGATAGDSAQGRLTEAEEIVGRITVDGTIGFIVFTGLFFGLPAGVVFVAIRRWLPAGRLAGVVYGGLLLVTLAPVLDPLRRDNPDFDIVGPGWLSVVVFAALVMAHGMTVAAVAGRYSQRLPLISRDRRTIVRYAPLLLLVPAFAAVLVIGLVGLVVVGLSQARPVRDAFRSGRAVLTGRLVLGALALLSAPRLLATVIDIAGRGPA